MPTPPSKQKGFGQILVRSWTCLGPCIGPVLGHSAQCRLGCAPCLQYPDIQVASKWFVLLFTGLRSECHPRYGRLLHKNPLFICISKSELSQTGVSNVSIKWKALGIITLKLHNSTFWNVMFLRCLTSHITMQMFCLNNKTNPFLINLAHLNYIEGLKTVDFWLCIMFLDAPCRNIVVLRGLILALVLDDVI